MVVASSWYSTGWVSPLVDGYVEDAYIGLEIQSYCDCLGGLRSSFFDQQSYPRCVLRLTVALEQGSSKWLLVTWALGMDRLRSNSIEWKQRYGQN